MAERTYKGRSPISGGILRMLQESIGLPVHADDLIKGVGLTRKEQISPAISYLKTEKGFDIETVIAGQVWRLRDSRNRVVEPDPVKRARQLYEQIGTLRDGTVVVQAEDDVLYKLQEL